VSCKQSGFGPEYLVLPAGLLVEVVHYDDWPPASYLAGA
jgi:hypothetical protein